MSFRDLMRRRASGELDAGLESAKTSGLPGFASFVRGIRVDYAAVSVTFSLEWSSGLTEGHVNRLKLIKWLMYG
jgi:transposase